MPGFWIKPLVNGSVLIAGEGQRERGLEEKVRVCFSAMINLKEEGIGITN